MAQNNKKQETSGISARVIVIAAAIMVVLAAGIAVFASGGSDKKSSDTTSAPAPGGVAAAEYQKVTVKGDALEALGKDVADPSLGKVAPNLSGYNFSGLPVSIKPATDGAPTMLVFLAHWCPHCNAEMPRLVSWYEKGLVPDDLRVIGIATASRQDQANWPPSEWVPSFDWPFEVMADSETNDAAVAYGVDGYPFMVILDKDGKVVARHSGEMDEAEIPNFVNKALGR
jgi:cytochrome c biogenesis protein CcmG, thiol:disulfide interchange protein DsbE